MVILWGVYSLLSLKHNLLRNSVLGTKSNWELQRQHKFKASRKLLTVSFIRCSLMIDFVEPFKSSMCLKLGCMDYSSALFTPTNFE